MGIFVQEIVGLADDLSPCLLDVGGRPVGPRHSRIYAAPEVFDGAPADVRSDVYSLGRVLAFLVLGAEPPIEGDRIPRLDCLARAPAGLSRIVRRATCVEPLLRYSGVAELVADLERYGDFENVGLMLPNAVEQNFTGLSSPPVSAPRNAVIPAAAAPGVEMPTKRKLAVFAGVLVAASIAIAMFLTNPIQSASQWWARGDLGHSDPARRGLAAQKLVELGDRRLAGANLEGADLTDARLAHSELGGANLSGARLDRADLAGADLKGANLSLARALGTDFSGAELEGASGLATVECDDQTAPPEGWACAAGQLAPTKEEQ